MNYIPFDFSYVSFNEIQDVPEIIPSFSGTLYASFFFDGVNQFMSTSPGFSYDNGSWKYIMNDDFSYPPISATYYIEQDATSSWILRKDNDVLFKLSGLAKAYLPFNYKNTEDFTYPAYSSSVSEDAYWVYVGNDSSIASYDICVKPPQIMFGPEAIVKLTFENEALSSDFNGSYLEFLDDSISTRKIFVKKDSNGNREFLLYYDDKIGRYVLTKYSVYQDIISGNPDYLPGLISGGNSATSEMIFMLSEDSTTICDDHFFSKNISKSYPFNVGSGCQWIAFGNDPDNPIKNVYVNFKMSPVQFGELIKLKDDIQILDPSDYSLIDDLL